MGMNIKTVSWGYAICALASIIFGFQRDLMDGIMIFILLSVLFSIAWGLSYQESVRKNLGMNNSKIFTWCVFVAGSILISSTIESVVNFPQIESWILGISTMAFIWWSYYAMEPATA